MSIVSSWLVNICAEKLYLVPVLICKRKSKNIDKKITENVRFFSLFFYANVLHNISGYKLEFELERSL